jgi:hypothetical protein
MQMQNFVQMPVQSFVQNLVQMPLQSFVQSDGRKKAPMQNRRCNRQGKLAH